MACRWRRKCTLPYCGFPLPGLLGTRRQRMPLLSRSHGRSLRWASRPRRIVTSGCAAVSDDQDAMKDTRSVRGSVPIGRRSGFRGVAACRPGDSCPGAFLQGKRGKRSRR
jgi:hypothetical protein